MNEVWKDITGYEGIYKVSNLGRVKSLSRIVDTKIGPRLLKEKIMKQVNWNKYSGVNLYDGNGGKKHGVHRLVAKAFIPNPQNKPEVNHIDGVKSNNILSNLEWVNKSEQALHAHRIGLSKSSFAKKYNESSSKSRPIYQLDLNGKLISKWPSSAEVKRKLNFHHSSITPVARGERQSAYGFKWSYELKQI